MSTGSFSSPNVAVVGAGIIGLSVAWRLLQAGASVSLYEKGEPGRRASWAAAGMLAPAYESVDPEIDHPDMMKAMLDSRSLWAEFASELEEISEVDIGYRPQSTLALALSEHDRPYLQQLRTVLRATGVEFDSLSSTDVRKLEPSIADIVLDGLLLPSDGAVDNRATIGALIAAVNRQGVQWSKQSAEIVMEPTLTSVLGIRTGSGFKEFDRVILCAGIQDFSRVWRLRAGVFEDVLAPPHIRHQLVARAEGSLLSYQTSDSDLTSIIRFGSGYITRQPNRIVVHRPASEDSWASANASMPWLNEMRAVDEWTEYRPKTPDGAPIVGGLGGNNVIWATGHFRNGILLAPITAEWVKALVFQEDCSDVVGFSPQRFRSSETE